jgi:hypothetical protein
MTLLILFIMLIYVTMVYGPIAAFLSRAVPDPDPLYIDVATVSHRQRLVRRHAAVARNRHGGKYGDIYYGLWYPIIVAIITVIVVHCS